MQRAFDGAKTVLHLAACQYHTPLAASTYDLPFFPVNVDGTRRVLDAARRGGAERLVFVSTNMVYGLPQQLPLTEAHVRNPFGPYGKSKLEAEKLVEAAHGNGLDTAIVRPGLIVGPGRIGVVARVFDWILAGKPIGSSGAGETTTSSSRGKTSRASCCTPGPSVASARTTAARRQSPRCASGLAR